VKTIKRENPSEKRESDSKSHRLKASYFPLRGARRGETREEREGMKEFIS
jgi:hypothetical protein